MTDYSLPVGDRDEGLPPPRHGESRTEWVRRMAVEYYGLAEQEDAPKPDRWARHHEPSFEERMAERYGNTPTVWVLDPRLGLPQTEEKPKGWKARLVRLEEVVGEIRRLLAPKEG